MSATTTIVKERPILLNSEMVNAVLESRKTQTRRVIKPQPIFVGPYVKLTYLTNNRSSLPVYAQDLSNRKIEYGPAFVCKYGKIGDQLWVRETWGALKEYDDLSPREVPIGSPVGYKTDDIGIWCQTGCNGAAGKWRPSIHMPRWASRIQLEITNIRVERVQDISDADARAEGVNGGCEVCGEPEPCGCASPSPLPIDAFIYLWNSINEQRGYGWDINPWVWVIGFRNIQKT